MVIKIHTPLSDATPADVGAGLDNEKTVNPADLLAALLATGPGTPNALQQAIQALVAPPSTSPSFATPAETIAGTSTTTIVNPADLYARENIPAQTGLGLVLSAIPAPTASQSPWSTNTLSETLHYAPGLGWKIVADLAGFTSPNIVVPGNTYNSIIAVTTMPRAGRVQFSISAFALGDATPFPGESADYLYVRFSKGSEQFVDGMSTNAPENCIANASGTLTVAVGDVVSWRVDNMCTNPTGICRYSYQYIS